MAQIVKTNRRQIRISVNKHYLEISTDGRNWNKGIGVEETQAIYLDLMSYKGKVFAVTYDKHYYGSIKVLDEYGSVKFSSSNMRNKIVRFEYSEDGLLHGLDEKGTIFVLNDDDGRDWVRYDTWKTEREWDNKNKKESISPERDKGRKKSISAIKPRVISTETPKRTYKGSYSSTGTRKMGLWGNMFVGVFGCLGTIVIVILFIWLLLKIF